MLCLSGFELYSCWVPLMYDSGMTACVCERIQGSLLLLFSDIFPSHTLNFASIEAKCHDSEECYHRG